MEKDPVDYILEKVICELLKKKEISSISQNCLNSLIDIVKNYICDIGRCATKEALEISRPNISINELLSAVMTKCSLVDLFSYMNSHDLPTVYGYSFPDSAFQHTVEVPPAHLNDRLPAFFKPLPSPHISGSHSVLSIERNQEKSGNRKRLLGERDMVKKSICCINSGSTVLWETKDIQEQRQQRTGKEQLPSRSDMNVTKNPSRLPDILKKKPVTIETENGIGIDN